MDDTISRQAAIDAFRKELCREREYIISFKGCERILSNMPSVDAVEVIRCKDCRHYGWTENRIPSEREWWCYELNDAREETDFCSHAERRQDEQVNV